MTTAAGAQAGASGQAPLDEVLRRPDEDEPRLAYAAWCDRQILVPSTSARGTFIRAQITLVRKRSTGTWDELHLAEHAANDARSEHGDAWDAPLRSQVQRVEYDRGFVELIAMSPAAFRDRAAELRQQAPIRHLDLTGVVEAGPEFWESEALAGIRSISMDRQELSDRDVAALARSPHLSELRWLSIQNNLLTEKSGLAMAASKGLGKLTYANFRGNPYDPTNQYSHDGEIVGSIWLPPEGKRLEARHGPLPWLHWAGHTFADLVPDRFRS